MVKTVNKLEDVSSEQWKLVDADNRRMVEEFLRESVQLSPYTIKQYESALKIFFNWVRENIGNKKFYEIKNRDFLLFQNFLVRRGLSSSAIRFKRASISSFNSYVETYYEDEYKTFRNYVTKKIPAPKQVLVHEKEPLTLDEYRSLCNELEKREMWQQLAYVKFSFSSGCRRNEALQLRKEVVDYSPKITSIELKNSTGELVQKESRSYTTHDIRCKGSGEQGKIRKLQFDEESMLAIKKWIEVRGNDDCPFVFVSRYSGEIRQISVNTFNLWCEKIFEEIVGRRVHPHLFRETRATSLVVEQGKDIKVAQKLLGHESSTTTEIYVIRDDDDASDEAFL